MTRSPRARAASWMLAVTCLSACAGAPARGDGYDRALAAGKRAATAGRWQEAAHHFDQASHTALRDRDRDYAAFETANAHRAAGDRGGALKRYEALAHGKGEYAAQASLRAADMLVEHDDAEDAWRAMERVALEHPSSAAARTAVLRLLRHVHT